VNPELLSFLTIRTCIKLTHSTQNTLMASLDLYTNVLGIRLAKHLLRRTSYRLNRERILYYASLTPQQAVDELFNFQEHVLSEPYDPATGIQFISHEGEIETGNFYLTRYVRCWWCDEATKDNSIGHMLEFFWHTIFPVNDAFGYQELFDHISLLRLYAQNGDFKRLARKMIMDPSMLLYLDNHYNSVGSPNENFAREYLELHTILAGPQDGPDSYTNYTEVDIQQAARLLTGFRVDFDRTTIDPETGIHTGRPELGRHDTGDKTFSDKFQNRVIVGRNTEETMEEELDDFVDMIFDQLATAENICRRMYRFFVSNEITAEVESDIITPLAASLTADPTSPDYYNFNTALRTLLTSQHFYDQDDAVAGDEIVGSLLRSPLELMLQSLTMFDVSPPDPTDMPNMQIHYDSFWSTHLSRSFPRAGMDFFNPETVAGYPAYHQRPNYSKNWFTTSNIVGRFRVPEMIIEGRSIYDSGNIGPSTEVPFNFAEFSRDTDFFTDASDAILLVQEFLDFTLGESVDEEREIYFRDIFLDALSPINWRFEWEGYIDTGDESAVKIPLDNLFIAVLYSEEYQLK